MDKVKNMVMQLSDSYYGELTIDFTDTIYRHSEERFDHLRYHIGKQILIDGEVKNYMDIRLLFLGRTALDLLAKTGVPEAYLDYPTPVTAKCLEIDTIDRMEQELGD